MPESIPALRVVPPERHIRFGPFELDSRAGELRKLGIKIRIGQQAFEVLLMILRQPGEVVLREEIRQKLWPHDTVVEFEHSINAVIQKLRDALGESADNPRYIETLPRRGYRFIGTVETTGEPVAVKIAPRNRWPVMIAGGTVVLVGLALAGWLRPWEARAPARNLMFSLGSYQGIPVMSPDGSAVFYCSRFRGVKLRRLDSLQDIPLTSLDPLNFAGWSPDGSQILGPSSAGFVRVPMTNGPTVTVNSKIGPPCGFSWGSSGYILLATCGDASELDLIPEKGGDPARQELPGFTNGAFINPEFLPDGRNFLFAWRPKGADALSVYLATLENGKITRAPILLRNNRTVCHYTPSGGGRLLCVQDDNLYAQRLNASAGARWRANRSGLWRACIPTG
jgi:DNA-binding winged helix-turn-helix (wHTH) protein